MSDLADDLRIASRRRALKAGQVSFRGGALITPTVRNLSQTGAALEAKSPIGIPDEFMLVLKMEQTKRPCKVVWRKGTLVGIRCI